MPPLPILVDAGLPRCRHADTLHTGNAAPPVSSASLPASTQLRGGDQHRGGRPCLRRTTRKTHIGVVDCSGAALLLLTGRWRDSTAHHATTMWAQTRAITVAWHCHSTPPTRPKLQSVDRPTTPASSKAWCALGIAPPTRGSRWRAMGHHASECPMLSCPALPTHVPAVRTAVAGPPSQRYTLVRRSALFNTPRWNGANAGLCSQLIVLSSLLIPRSAASSHATPE
jgi:hypothetical protein